MIEIPAVASSLLVNGVVVSQTSFIGADRPNLHPAVLAFVDSLPEEKRRSFTGRCAETALISDQLWALDSRRSEGGHTDLQAAEAHFRGAVLTSRMIREPGNQDHGKAVSPCPVCSALLARLNVSVMD
ncbi:YwqJ-related putative deaminase [Streptomyces longwoodensis]|uniref:YwqJ-related putative deaminase n=1 Tax=Streptomyces longwoodensis TaxID=68231 RepID=UPI0034079295